MSDHIKVLAEMSGISVDVMRAIVAAQEQEKFICDSLGVASLGELEQLKKSAKLAAALNWLSAKTIPERAVGRSISGAANPSEPVTSASDTPEREPSTSPADELHREAMPQITVMPEQADRDSQVPAAQPVAETKPAKSGKTANWHDAARAIADELELTDKAPGRDPVHSSVTDMADRVAVKMRERGIEGPLGPVSGATVKREALQGGRWKRPKPQATTGGNGGTEKP